MAPRKPPRLYVALMVPRREDLGLWKVLRNHGRTMMPENTPVHAAEWVFETITRSLKTYHYQIQREEIRKTRRW
jgi:hypothetical protein